MGDDGSHPKLFFINDFPPFASSGGALLIERLFAGIPSRWVHVAYSSCCRYRLTDANPHHYDFIVLPELSPNGRWGLGRLRLFINYLLIPLNTILAVSTAKKKKINVIVTVAHDRLCLIACLTSLILKKPLITIVHDDWAFLSARGSFLPSYRIYSRLFGWMLAKSSRIYAVSEGMSRHLSDTYGSASTPQYPSVDINPSINPDAISTLSEPRFTYLGNYGGDNSDCLNLLVEALMQTPLKTSGGLNDWSLHLYTGIDEALKAELEKKWGNARVHLHSWIAQEKIPGILKESDILVLPHSFRRSQIRFVNKSLPTKTADYLNSGKLILIIAPPYSALSQYAKRYGFGEVVEEFSADAVVRGIMNLCGNADYRREKIENSRKALDANHDVEKQRKEFMETLLALSGSGKI